MGRGSASKKLDRLDQILGHLKSGDPVTASLLAEDIGVSVRTLMRDLDTLKARGYPIETEQGRGGGVRLTPRWGIGRLTLNYREVIDLLLSLSVLEKLNSPLFFSHLSSVRNKLFASFPDAQRPAIRKLRQRILLGKAASEQVMQSYVPTQKSKLTDAVIEAFVEQRSLIVDYQREDGALHERAIEPHYLFLNWPVWYVLVWDHSRDAARTFRIDRVKRVQPLSSRFRLKPLSQFSNEVEQMSRQL